GGDFLALGYQRARADQRVVADARAVEDDRAHADQHVVADRAAVDDGAMADGAPLAHHHRTAGIGVHDDVFLQVGAVADGNRLAVAARHRAEPDANILAEPHLADDGRTRRYPVAAG